jgi:hypothetical protein
MDLTFRYNDYYSQKEVSIMKKLTILMIAPIILIVLAAVFAKTSFGQSPSRVFSLPENAKSVAENVYYLGHAKDVNGHDVEAYAFVHRKDAQVKPVKPPRGGGPSCYGYLANGAKWKTVEDYIVDPTNTRGLSGSFVESNLDYDIGKWEAAAAKNILGNKIPGVVDGADTVSPDNKNEVLFADIADSNAIAVTIVWGYFSGPPQLRELVEWDQVYDDVDYDWSSSGEVGKMDFENIVTHELGHTFGMGDLYDTTCSDVTMYGYANYGETKKQSLEQPDIVGVQNLYK